MMRSEDRECPLPISMDPICHSSVEAPNPSADEATKPSQGRRLSINHQSPPSTNPSILYLLCLFYAFLCMGFGTGITTSTFLRISEQTNSTVDQLAWIFFARSCGFFSGTTFAGLLFDRFPSSANTFLAIAVFIMSATTLVIPLIHQMILLLPAQLTWGLAAGFVDNLTQVSTIKFYSSRNVGPYLQALHSAFGIGAFVSPLIVAQFLSSRNDPHEWHYAYFIVFLMHLPDFIWLSYYSISRSWCGKQRLKSNEIIELEIEEFLNTNSSAIHHISAHEKVKPVQRQSLFLWLLAPFFFCYVGGQYGFISYLNTYATLHFHFPKETAAYLNSVFWASFVVGRLSGIVCSLKVSPQKMIFGNLLGCLASLVLLLVCNKLPSILWIGSILFALFVASIYSSAVAYAEQYIKITGKRMSMLTVCGALGDATIPLWVGMSINSTLFGYPNFIIMTMSFFILASIVFAVNVLCIARSPAPKGADDKAKMNAYSDKSVTTDCPPNLL